jgi:hypothetical protein
VTNRAGRAWLDLAVVACALGCLHAVWRQWSGWPDLSTHLRDDAFYEFTWAVNLFRGEGPTVSDGTTTSGVQLLWSLLLSVVAGGRPESIVDMAVLLGLGCHILGALTILVSCRGQRGAAAIALLWLGNPLLLRESQNGQESALSALCLLWLWLLRSRPWPWFTIASLLAAMARTEFVGFVLLFSLARRDATLGMRLLLPAGIALALVGINLEIGGGLAPDSAAPMSWLVHANFAAASPGFWAWLAEQWWYLRPVLLGSPYELAQPVGVGVLVWLAMRSWWPRAFRLLPGLAVACAYVVGVRDLLVVAVASLLLVVFPKRRLAAWRRDAGWLLVGAAAVVFVHWALRWYPRDYYAVPVAVVGSIALLLVRRMPGVLLLAAVLQATTVELQEPEPLRHQISMDLAGRYLGSVLDAGHAGERVGSFNSGIVGFRQLQSPAAARMPVVNLDGVVDSRAFLALRRGELGRWLDEQGIRLLLDHPVQFVDEAAVPHASGHWFGAGFDAAEQLVELARFLTLDDYGRVVDAGRPGTAEVRLYWRKGRGLPLAVADRTEQLADTIGGRAVVRWVAEAGSELLVEAADATRRMLLRSDADTVVVLALWPGLGPDARLWGRGADGRETPLLTLRR